MFSTARTAGVALLTAGALTVAVAGPAAAAVTTKGTKTSTVRYTDSLTKPRTTGGIIRIPGVDEPR